MKKRNNWIWRNPFKYAIIGMGICFIIFIALILTFEQYQNSLLILLMIIVYILVYDGYRRDNQYEWKCPACNYKVGYGERYKYCPKCGYRMKAVKKEEQITLCPYCKYKLKPDMVYCPKCGNYIGKKENSSVEVT